jgi:hypothetical protein
MVAINPDWLAEHPDWTEWMEAWKKREDQRWTDAEEFRDQGYTFIQAGVALGLWQDMDELKDKLGRAEKLNTEKDQTIEAGRHENAGQKHTIEELERDKKALERDNEALHKQLAAWESRARNPLRGPLGRFR